MASFCHSEFRKGKQIFVIKELTKVIGEIYCDKLGQSFALLQSTALPALYFPHSYCFDFCLLCY